LDPSDGWMKPYPLVVLKNFTVPVGMNNLRETGRALGGAQIRIATRHDMPPSYRRRHCFGETRAREYAGPKIETQCMQAGLIVATVRIPGRARVAARHGRSNQGAAALSLSGAERGMRVRLRLPWMTKRCAR
jgi:hypothetical protein